MGEEEGLHPRGGWGQCGPQGAAVEAPRMGSRKHEEKKLGGPRAGSLGVWAILLLGTEFQRCWETDALRCSGILMGHPKVVPRSRLLFII